MNTLPLIIQSAIIISFINKIPTKKNLNNKTLLSILFIAFSNSIFAQIYATNKTDEPIWVATVTYQKNGIFSGYVSNGWYKIIPVKE
jgi:hypothetical protein